MFTRMRDRSVSTLAFLMITLAALAIVLTSTPEPWEGVYKSYAPTWLFLVLGAIFILWRIERGDFSWFLLGLWGILFSITVGAISVQWGWVYGFHDPWAHYANIKFQVFDLTRTPYPAFHIWNTHIGDLIGVRGTTVLQYTALLATVLGGIGLVVVLRVLPLSHKKSQRAFVAGLPAIFFGFIPRPFTLGWPFVIFIAWAVFTPLDRRQVFGFLILLGVGLTALHPQIPFLVSAFLLAAIVVEIIRPELPSSFRDTTIPFAARQLASLIGVYAVVVSVYFFVFSDFGERALDRFSEMLGQEGGETPNNPSTGTGTDAGGGETPNNPSTGTNGVSPDENGTQTDKIPTPSEIVRRPTKVSQLAKVIRQPELITELLARLSFILVLGCFALISTLERFREYRFANEALVALVAASLYGLFYIFADVVLNNALIGAMRSVQLLPIVLVPGIAFALRHRNSRIPYINIVFVLLILISGLAVAYQSDFTGANVKTATDEQVTGVEWLGTYVHNKPVIGTDMTFWILQGQFGRAKIFELAPANADAPPKVYTTRRVGFSWQVSDPDGFIIIDEIAKAQARQEVSESGDMTPLRDLETMPIRHSRVYTNGGTDIYGNRTIAGG